MEVGEQKKTIQFKIDEIDEKINKEKSNKTTGVVLMIISIFFLWPILIVGIIIWSKANNEVDKLETEKKKLEWELFNLNLNENKA